MFKLIRSIFKKKQIERASLLSKDLSKAFKNKLDEEFLLKLETILLKADSRWARTQGPQFNGSMTYLRCATPEN